jgi:hypothetical protein
MRLTRSIGLALLALACFGCGSGPQPHLEKSWIDTLSRGTIGIVYMDPEEPVGVLRYRGGKTINGSEYNGIEEKLAYFAPLIGREDPIGRDYEAVHATLMSIPWLANARWQRLQSPSDPAQAKSAKELVKEAGTDVVIIVYPHTMIYADGDPLTVRCEIEIYTASPAGSYNSTRIESRILDGVAPLGPDGSDSLPNPMFYNQYLRHGEELDQQLAVIFQDDGAVFYQAHADALARLKAGLWFYFTSTQPPAGG